MNKIDFKNLKKQIRDNLNLFEDKIFDSKQILSFVFKLNPSFKINTILNNSNIYINSPICFLNKDFKSIGLVKEKDFSFLDVKQFKDIQLFVVKLLSKTKFINKKKSLNKTFIFGGYNFNPQKDNINIWKSIPKGYFILPRYIFFNNHLIINLFLSSKEFNKNIFLKYVDDLKLILYKENVEKKSLIKKIEDIDKNKYLNNLSKAISIVNSNKFKLDKVVLSRTKKISYSNMISRKFIINNLFNKNKNNMNFLFSFSDKKLIIGSSPELILSLKDKYLKSESLAGSNYKNQKKELISDIKEIQEQKIVTDYILDFFNINTTNIQVNKEPIIKKSANMLHLCTKISGLINSNKNILNLLKDLHPTPAIAGKPRAGAIDFISKIENRGWYGGPIGWIDSNLDSNFYLNIRSGLIVNNDIYLFSGSGITDKSELINEFKETEKKFNLMIEACNE